MAPPSAADTGTDLSAAAPAAPIAAAPASFSRSRRLWAARSTATSAGLVLVFATANPSWLVLDGPAPVLGLRSPLSAGNVKAGLEFRGPLGTLTGEGRLARGLVGYPPLHSGEVAKLDAAAGAVSPLRSVFALSRSAFEGWPDPLLAQLDQTRAGI